ncbi:MAG TPA: RNA polymerase sigma-70 factor [Puia sp.]|nr:RNA polymerase sigma-70 factor [Puia sp.]
MADVAENNWLGLVAIGDEDAFRSLYDEYAGKVYAMAVYYLKSPLEAQDVVQDVFLKIWEKSAELDTIHNFRAWLRVLTRNHLINSLQRKIPSNFKENMAGREFADNAPTPLQRFDHNETAGMIRRAVEALAPRQQQVYRMSRDSNLTFQEIGRELGISPHTVKEHMSAALRNIRDYLEEHFGPLGLLIFILLNR